MPPVDPRYLVPDSAPLWAQLRNLGSAVWLWGQNEYVQFANDIDPIGRWEYSSYFQIDEVGNQIGRWYYDYGLSRWVYETLDYQSRLPQTEVLRWPIPVLAVIGTLMIGVGIYIIRKAENVDN
jgi:hypothetical protein